MTNEKTGGGREKYISRNAVEYFSCQEQALKK